MLNKNYIYHIIENKFKVKLTNKKENRQTAMDMDDRRATIDMDNGQAAMDNIDKSIAACPLSMVLVYRPWLFVYVYCTKPEPQKTIVLIKNIIMMIYLEFDRLVRWDHLI